VITDKSGKMFTTATAYNAESMVRIDLSRAARSKKTFKLLTAWLHGTAYTTMESDLKDEKVQAAIREVCNSNADVTPINKAVLNPHYIWAQWNKDIGSLSFVYEPDACYRAPAAIKGKKEDMENIRKGTQMLVRSLQHIYNAMDLVCAAQPDSREAAMLNMLKSVMVERKTRYSCDDLFSDSACGLSSAYFFEAMYSYWYDLVASKKECRTHIYATF
jgi:hypothetical protein